MRIRQKLSNVLTLATASFPINLCLRVRKRAVRHAQSSPRRQRNGQFVRFQMRSDNLTSKSHVCFDGNEVFGSSGERGAGGGFKHVSSVFRVKCGDGCAEVREAYLNIRERENAQSNVERV